MELMCSICSLELDIYTRWPRLIPNTGETICQCCVQQIVDGSICQDHIQHIQSDLEQVSDIYHKLQHLKNNPLKIDDFPLNQSLLRILQLQKAKKTGTQNSINQTFEEWTTEEHSLDSHAFLDALSQASSIKKQKKTTISRCSPEHDDSFASLNYSYNSNNAPNAKLCSVHRRQLEVVCLQCKTMICTNCALFGAHKSHEMQSEENMISILEMKGAELIEIVEKIHGESESVSMQQYDAQFRSLINQKQTTIINKIISQFADLRKQIDYKEKSIIEAVNYTFDKQIQSWNEWWQNNQFYNQCQLWLSQAQTTFNKFTDSSNRYWDLLEMTEGLQKRGTQLQNDIKKNITYIITKKESILQEQIILRFNPLNVESFCCVNPQSQQDIEETDLLDNISPSPSFNCSQFNDSPFGKQSQPLQQITPQQNTNFMRNMRSITPKQIENQEPSSPMLKTSRKRSAVPMKIQMQLDELRKGKGDVAEFNIDLTGELLQTLINEMKYWKVKTVKLLKCNLTDESLSSILRVLPTSVISLNVSQNQLTDKSVDAILIQGQLSLKNIVLSQNKINARNVKNKVMDLKKAGLSITL